ncbi:hypothetical protein BW730_15730 [Tessaracoccus aquimaris]|uniref:YdhG-like domain-containing protein n=1 Tax=Tessaracoccus aquimaris TaxID=1332264 RepID=A0A1Q2CRH7_9ACTN|nr:DUF1801 domain-containing protein [Tessaracoccus aquimaris]AQP48738.1 hypothetical protein BW730_15730 [Tessaracoccus aquimaris]
MGTIDDYLATLDPADAAIIARAYEVARLTVPEAEQGTGYGMPALTYKGKGLLSVMRTRQHFGVYPFSGKVVSAAEDLLEGVDHSKGTIRFQATSPLSDEVVERLVTLRRAELD